MKKYFLLAIIQILVIVGYGQISQGFKYQAIIRDAEGTAIVDEPILFKVTLKSANSGDVYFSEEHNVTTNSYGLISIIVGQGEPSMGSFDEVAWSDGNIVLETDIMLSGQTSYEPLGQSELYPVPYALYATNGQQGEQGVGIVNTIDNGDGTYTFEYSDGTSFTTSSLVGPLVEGTSGQTLYHDGTSWVASSNIHNNNVNVGIGTVTPSEKLEVMGNIKAHGTVYSDNIEVNQPTPIEEPIFVVRNSLGQIVFAVYESGVRVYVDDSSKYTRGGFAVGGLSDQGKVGEAEFLRVTPDSVRINLKVSSAKNKGFRGGFAVGGLSDQGKTIGQEYLFIDSDSARIYFNEPTTKYRRGGFAVGGLSDQGKTISQDYLFIGSDSSRVYFKEPAVKGFRGGFAVGGLSDQGKADEQKYFFVGRDSARIYVKDPQDKGFRGGFAVGGLSDQGKAEPTSFMHITPDNYFIGHESGINVQPDGLYNSTLGYQTGIALTTGQQNIFIGHQAGNSNSTGSWNTFIGYRAGYVSNSSYNTFVGYQVGLSNTSGEYNSFLGYNAGVNNTTGSNNVFIGNKSGLAN
ncbi:MAG TPA: hypothetical protein PLV65_09125, partial [Tenuifilaceae bacterium]|nr:hypothetical protein [Tenuifilaceae bacterium]